MELRNWWTTSARSLPSATSRTRSTSGPPAATGSANAVRWSSSPRRRSSTSGSGSRTPGEIIDKTVLKGEVIDRLLYVDPATGEKVVHEDDVPFYKKQTRLVFGQNSKVDPESMEDYLAIGGYSALGKALTGMKPEEIIQEVIKANLRGRGGGGFPAGWKWDATRKATGDPKYVICNADEGDPGAYMDRSLLEGNPHLVLEGMIIGAYAIGSSQGYIYARNEYPLAVKEHHPGDPAGPGSGAPRREYPGVGFLVRREDQPGRRRVRLRRVLGPLRLPGGTGRRAPREVHPCDRQGPL